MSAALTRRTLCLLWLNCPQKVFIRRVMVDSVELNFNEQLFRAHLASVLAERCRKNTSYSLRSYAKSLQVESSALSKILKGKRRITRKSFVHFSSQLGLGERQLRAFFCANTAQTPSEVLSLDAFNLIADWYHYAIIELTKVKNFNASPKWIAKALGITVTEVNLAIDRLLRLKLLERHAKGAIRSTKANYTTVTGTPFTAAALKNHQRQLLNKALQALEEVPIEERDQSAVCLAVNKAHLAEAKHRIKEFRRQMSDLLEEGDDKSEVYHLVVSLFPVTRISHRRKKS